MYEKIEKILNKFEREEESYVPNIYEEDLKTKETIKYNLEEEMVKIFKNFGITQYDFCYIGGFDSPGYSVDCMCIAYIDLEGKLQTIPINYEIC